MSRIGWGGFGRGMGVEGLFSGWMDGWMDGSLYLDRGVLVASSTRCTFLSSRLRRRFLAIACASARLAV